MTAIRELSAGRASPNVLTDRFEREVIPWTTALYSHAMSLTGNRTDAEDLLQDTLLRAFTGFRSFREGTNLRAWLYRIQTNTYITGWRRRQRRPEVSVTYENEYSLQARDLNWSSGHPKSAEDEALLVIPDSDIASAIGDLAPSSRTVVYYADVVGLPVKYIAALTETPIGTVSSRLHRARRRLRAHMQLCTDTATTIPPIARRNIRPDDAERRVGNR